MTPTPSLAPRTSPLWLLLAITASESFATILIEKGIYFYTRDVLQFSDKSNLWLGLGIGVFYVMGALLSHKISKAIGEKNLLLFTFASQMLCHLGLMAFPATAPFLVFTLLLQIVTGLKWPVLESYVSAGRGQHSLSKAIGRFNMSWAFAVPVAMFFFGPLTEIKWINTHIAPGAGVFVAAACIHLTCFLSCLRLEPTPSHLAHDAPERPDPILLLRYEKLMVSSRWTMMLSYLLIFFLTPVIPSIFGMAPENAQTDPNQLIKHHLGFSLTWAPAMNSFVELVRAIAFLALFLTPVWHNKSSMLTFAAITLPLGFLMTLFGGDIAALLPESIAWGTHLFLVMAGLFLVSLGSALAYYGALYYAMVVANASVDAGGSHEGLIGSGFALGPALGLISLAASNLAGSPIIGMMLAVLPCLALGLYAGLRPLAKLKYLKTA
jgi:hypothetical protein